MQFDTTRVSRRRFLRGSLAATASLAAPAIIPARALGAEGKAAANSRLNVAMIGIGRQAYFANLPPFLAHPDTQVVAVCEVDAWRLGQAMDRVKAHYAKETGNDAWQGCSAHRDFREVLAKKDVDAVMISTPDHWHAIMAIEAAKAGKDVSLEKPISMSVQEGRAISDAMKRYDRIFRVDNPHTKPFPFWEWLIAAVRREYPDAIFLAEAFTRPAVLHHLAKLGFSQSYNYFAWRNTSQELSTYVNELMTEPGADYLRPNFWPNTPDILTGYLQSGGRPAFMVRLVLAATLAGSYGIYGPAFELCEDRPREPGSEEYLDSEKYQLRQWDLANPWSLREFIARVNAIRHTSPAFRNHATLRFHPVDNDRLLCYSRSLPDGGETVVVVVNLDPRFKQSGYLELDPEVVRVEPGGMYQAHDLLGGGRYLWQGSRNYVELDPATTPAHIFLLRTKHRTEREFEYFL